MSKKKESKVESPVKVIDFLTEKLERLTKCVETLAKLHDENCARGNKAFEELEKKLEQCNFITQETFLKNNVDLMGRLNKLEKQNLCKRCEWIKKHERIPTVVDTEAPQYHCDSCELKNFNLYCLTPKPQIGEIWKTQDGNYFLIKEIHNPYYVGEGVDIQTYWFRSPKLKISDNFDNPVFAISDLKEKVC